MHYVLLSMQHFFPNSLLGRTIRMSTSAKRKALEKDFEDFFSLCHKQGLSKNAISLICRPLLWSSYVRLARKLALVLIIFVTIYAMFCYMDCVSWFSSAIGRLILIKMLPYWNWTPLYNTKCLLERMPNKAEKPLLPPLGKYETDSANCVLCKGFDGIPTATNVSFSFIEEHYLERGLPVIITDSHDPKSLQHFLQLMLTDTRDFLESVPCDLSTNLMLKKLFRVDLAIEKARSLLVRDKWFLQLRNCNFKAVKSSRRFVTRPYYYPLHLEPFYSSWVLISNNYAELEQDIDLVGLIFVQQISGFFDFYLRPKRPCDRSCPTVNIRLEAGECLVFSTDIWMLSYGTGTAESKLLKYAAAATILEIDWRL